MFASRIGSLLLHRSESVFDTVPGKNLNGRLDLQA
jgi:hypothetical protein